jgi:hypothetical protein
MPRRLTAEELRDLWDEYRAPLWNILDDDIRMVGLATNVIFLYHGSHGLREHAVMQHLADQFPHMSNRRLRWALDNLIAIGLFERPDDVQLVTGYDAFCAKLRNRRIAKP